MMVRLGDRSVGEGHPAFIVAEAGFNHNGRPDLALQLVDAAARAGVDAVKFQTFRGDRLASAHAQGYGGAVGSQVEAYRQFELDGAAYAAIFQRAAERGILVFSTPFDEESADLLEGLGMAVFKIASGDLTHHPLLAHVARKKKPMILSTGMASLVEIEEALDVVRQHGHPPLVLLQCTSAYPAAPADANLRAIPLMKQVFGLPVGFSDHTIGALAPAVAVALGACVIEKHFTLDRALPGVDHAMSVDPIQMAALVAAVRETEAFLRLPGSKPIPAEEETRYAARRGLVAARKLPAGTLLTRDLVDVKRPAAGLPSRWLSQIIGRTLRRPLERDEPITWDVV